MENNVYEMMSSEYLVRMGFNIGSIGFDYLKQAIDYCIDNEDLLDGITTKLYPKVAERFGVKSAVVERGIRGIIDKAYKKGGFLEINTFYNKIIYNNDFKFSNSEFIALMVYRIKFDIAKIEIANKYNIVLTKYED